MNPQDIGALTMAFAAGVGFAQGWNAVRRARAGRRRAPMSIYPNGHPAAKFVVTPVHPGRTLLDELDDHTCSFGDACSVKRRAAQLRQAGA